MSTNLKIGKISYLAPELSIVVVNFNTKDLLDQCLSSLYSTVKEHRFEIIVVDNNSLDDSTKMVKSKYSEVYLIENKRNVGFARANNQAIKIGKSEYFLLLNPDTLVLEESIDKMIEFMKNGPQIGVLGPRVLNPNRTIQYTSCGNFPTPLRVLLWQAGFRINKKWGTSNPWYLNPNKTGEVEWISGVCMLVRKEIFNQIGLMDEKFFSYFEDIDFCYRARKGGWTVYYFNDAEIVHLLGQSWRFIESVKVKLESELLFLHKYYGRAGVFLAILFTIYGSLLRIFIWRVTRFLNKELGSTKILEHNTILSFCFSKI